jgi:hypothetical protein
VYASLALRHGIGKVTKKFPPRVSVTEEERKRIVELARGSTRKRRVTMEKGARETRLDLPPYAPDAKGEVPHAIQVAVDRGLLAEQPKGEVSGDEYARLGQWGQVNLKQSGIPIVPEAPKGENSHAIPAGGVYRAAIKSDDPTRQLLQAVAFRDDVPADLRKQAFALLVG